MVNCTASDGTGNVGTASFTVTVVPILPPRIAAACRALDRAVVLLERLIGAGSIKPAYGAQLIKAARAAKASLGSPTADRRPPYLPTPVHQDGRNSAPGIGSNVHAVVPDVSSCSDHHWNFSLKITTSSSLMPNRDSEARNESR